MTAPSVAELSALDWRKAGQWSNELLFALASRGQGQARQLLLTRLPTAEIEGQMSALQKLFAPTSR